MSTTNIINIPNSATTTTTTTTSTTPTANINSLTTQNNYPNLNNQQDNQDLVPVPTQIENYKLMERNFIKASTPQRGTGTTTSNTANFNLYSESDSDQSQSHSQAINNNNNNDNNNNNRSTIRNRFNSINESNQNPSNNPTLEFVHAFSTSPTMRYQVATSPSSTHINAKFFINNFVGGAQVDPILIDDLEEETILDSTHNDNVEKLNCILVLCNYLIELAKSRFNPLLQNNHNMSNLKSNVSSTGGPSSSSSNKSAFDQFTVADVAYKKAEQLVIYLKCLQLLKPVLCYAKDELQAYRLRSTAKVKKIMRQLNNMYKFCLYQSKQLYITEFTNKAKWGNELINLSADKLLYLHAIENCREAAMEEFFGKPQKVIKNFLSSILYD
jgi:hypothetical protein